MECLKILVIQRPGAEGEAQTPGQAKTRARLYSLREHWGGRSPSHVLDRYCGATEGSGAGATEWITTQRRREIEECESPDEENLILELSPTGCMAKHPRRRRRRNMGRYLPGNVDRDVSLGTLASRTAILSSMPTVTERTRVSSIDATWSLSGITVGDNVGPVQVGYAHSDYSLAEIEANLELGAGSWSQGNKIDQEIANRLIRIVGTLDMPSVSTGDSTSLNDGKPIKTKLNWTVITGQSINVFCYNLGTAAFSTTDPNVHCQGKAHLWVL